MDASSPYSTPQPPPVEEGVPVTDSLVRVLEKSTLFGSVIELVKQRAEYGMKKYGQSLMTRDGRDDVVDAMQEMGDLLQYAYKARLNGRGEELGKALAGPLFALMYVMDLKEGEL